jgi:tetratricopeptide (TPR) repeat protein
MLLSYQGVSVSQKELGDILRPRQHPRGIEDDKSVTISELALEAERRGFSAYHRPGGSIELLKMLIANDFPVLVRTWLNSSDDIGHYRVVRGFDDLEGQLVQDDSLQGEGLRYDYSTFEDLWLPFQYEFLVIARPDQAGVMEALLGDLANQKSAWQKFYNQSQKAIEQQPESTEHIFNQSIAAFHLGNFQESIQLFEQVQKGLSERMLWYQIQPIEAYLEMGNYEKVFALTDSILTGPNKAFSELYMLRGEAYERLGNPQVALSEYELALLYNKNLQAAQEKLRELRGNL